jgi:hypothetical protein
MTKDGVSVRSAAPTVFFRLSGTSIAVWRLAGANPYHGWNVALRVQLGRELLNNSLGAFE